MSRSKPQHCAVFSLVMVLACLLSLFQGARAELVCGDSPLVKRTGSLKVLEAAGRRGDELALYSLALHYLDGHGVLLDPVKARQFAERAGSSEKSSDHSKTLLALLYRDGVGGGLEYEKSEHLLLSVDYSRCPRAKTELAILYQSWKTFDHDVKAKALLEEAVEDGDAKALYLMANRILQEGDYEKDQLRYQHFITLSAKKGYPPGQYLKAVWEMEYGSEEDGVGLLKQPAERGYPPAQYAYALVLRSGKYGENYDPLKSTKMMSAAACQGLVRAQTALARFHRQGQGIQKNNVSALAWLAIAMRATNSDQLVARIVGSELKQIFREREDLRSLYQILLNSNDKRLEVVEPECRRAD